jgi:hypothetical protein
VRVNIISIHPAMFLGCCRQVSVVPSCHVVSQQQISIITEIGDVETRRCHVPFKSWACSVWPPQITCH